MAESIKMEEENGSSSINQVTKLPTEESFDRSHDGSDSPGSDQESTCTVRSVVRYSGNANDHSTNEDEVSSSNNICDHDDQMILSVTKLVEVDSLRRLKRKSTCDDEHEFVEIELIDKNNTNTNTNTNYSVSNSNAQQAIVVSTTEAVLPESSNQMFAQSYRFASNHELRENLTSCRLDGANSTTNNHHLPSYRARPPKSLANEAFSNNNSGNNNTNNNLNNNNTNNHYHENVGQCETTQTAATVRGFAEVQPKLTAASQRVREYLESLKNHRGLKEESGRLYQFFKSIRTELVACLLFTLISSYALILARNQFNGPPPSSPLIISSLSSSYSTYHHHQQQQEQVTQNNNNNQEQQQQENHRVSVHLTRGLADSLTVATLTQVFGHISGCHLSPSISLALYVKGHITSVRLVAYLAAQSAGALAGAGLLAALTSSQINLPGNSLFFASISKLAQPLESSGSLPASTSSVTLAATANLVNSKRRKRETKPVGVPNGSSTLVAASTSATTAPTGVAAGEAAAKVTVSSSYLTDESSLTTMNLGTALEEREPSEGLLMSIMEQVGAARQRGPEVAGSSTASSTAPPGKSNMKNETKVVVSIEEGGASEPMKDNGTEVTVSRLNSTSASGSVVRQGGQKQQQQRRRQSQEKLERRAMQTPATVWDDAVDDAVGEITNRLPSTTALADSSTGTKVETINTSGTYQNDKGTGNLTDNGEPTQQQQRQQPQAIGKVVRLKRRKRNRRQQTQAQNLDFSSSSSLSQNQQQQQQYELSRTATVNLLQFALPDPIMSDDSSMECLRFQRQFSLTETNSTATLTTTSTSPVTTSQANEQKLGGKMFVNCLSLPNGSQMFVFQLLASLLVILTYLANSDPRRSDLGHKSLSIGISYFVANLLTSQAGGYFANPIQVLALSWLASSPIESTVTSWHDEWFILLLVPLVSGLFGALSHEYIDFTSARNRNKRLHLRRSFHSLDTLDEINGCSGVGGDGNHSNSSNNYSNLRLEDREAARAGSGEEHLGRGACFKSASPASRRSTMATDQHELVELPSISMAQEPQKQHQQVAESNGNKPRAAVRGADRKSRANQLILLRNQRHQLTSGGSDFSSHSSSPSKSTRSTSIEQLNSSPLNVGGGASSNQADSNAHENVHLGISSSTSSTSAAARISCGLNGNKTLGAAIPSMTAGQTVSRNAIGRLTPRAELMPNGFQQVNNHPSHGRRNSMDFDSNGNYQHHQHQLALRRPSDFDANFLISSLSHVSSGSRGGGGASTKGTSSGSCEAHSQHNNGASLVPSGGRPMSQQQNNIYPSSGMRS